ncbi:hypothetical protein SASPL_118215 [Salvia splendens]|uniref:Remorin C-terminal domain-containing protein n=1 Tax=Salvia splendens TaxID=180675 RepID=A0A8X8XWY2_SALSN|nr:uncharacterized protein LOC121810031 [Salvia splendens]XP_042066845.1 uncharacterized protein LOC121810031 [Salvia splendens]XP_042066846.1 uncharacterized protein LOC121810031 [Salvia splendens]XP_042066847.1 uncharacterized protein LOC121810031 [Salvia splendens]XP_042066848.1 uncharacterized protein LOC121810031 [Salvia splendens]KAG6421658.1 hypothetical protein SASPL_118215 [Salvia splendens]
MRRNSGPPFRNSGAFTSPGTPEYGDHFPKTWSSERVPLPASSGRRHVSASALMPFNSGRTVPSKWDDAERWITSPISGFGAFNAVAAQRRPKSKSGPLGPTPTGLVYFPNYSPIMHVHEGRTVRNFMANSPLTTGVLVPEGLSVHYESEIDARSRSLYAEDDRRRGASMIGLSDMLSEISEPSSQDDKVGDKEEEALVSRRDMATQMSPDGSTRSSSKARLSFSTRSSVPMLERLHAGKDDIRDVQVDNTCTGPRKQEVEEMDSPTTWDVTESSKNMSKFEREEAKICAWEKLQKAKAEAAMRKLEVKLEKKRSGSMEKITKKLREAQTKAEAMRSTLSGQAAPPTRMSCSLYFKLCSICSCFICTKR